MLQSFGSINPLQLLIRWGLIVTILRKISETLLILLHAACLRVRPEWHRCAACSWSKLENPVVRFQFGCDKRACGRVNRFCTHALMLCVIRCDQWYMVYPARQPVIEHPVKCMLTSLEKKMGILQIHLWLQHNTVPIVLLYNQLHIFVQLKVNSFFTSLHNSLTHTHKIILLFTILLVLTKQL